MTPFEHIAQLAASVDGALVCGLVDPRERRLLSFLSTEAASPELEGALLAATLEMVDRPRSEALLDAESARAFREVQIHDERTRYFAKALNDNRVLVLVTRRDTNAGLSWAQVRAIALRLETETDSSS